MGTPYVTTQTLRFCDTDKLGHVNNAVYAVMYEAGRAELMDMLGLIDPAASRGVVIARIEIDFQREMNWPGEVSIETAIARIGTKSMHLRQRLLVRGEQASASRSVLAVIDTNARRAVPIEDAWRERMAGFVVEEESAAGAP